MPVDYDDDDEDEEIKNYKKIFVSRPPIFLSSYLPSSLPFYATPCQCIPASPSRPFSSRRFRCQPSTTSQPLDGRCVRLERYFSVVDIASTMAPQPKCLNSLNGTCDNTTCEIYTNSVHPLDQTVVIQLSLSFLQFAIATFCLYSLFKGARKQHVHTWKACNVFIHHTSSSIFVALTIGALARGSYYLTRIESHFVPVTFNAKEGCCRVDQDSSTFTRLAVSGDFLLAARDVSFVFAFLLLLQSWISVQQGLLPVSQRDSARFSKYRAIVVILILTFLRTCEFITRVFVTTLKDDDTFVHASTGLRIASISVYAVIFVNALPYGLQMLTRLKAALKDRPAPGASIQNEARRKDVVSPLEKTFTRLQRFMILEIVIMCLFWITHVVVLFVREADKHMEYCDENAFNYLKFPEKIFEVLMIVVLIETLGNRQLARRAASNYSYKNKVSQGARIVRTTFTTEMSDRSDTSRSWKKDGSAQDEHDTVRLRIDDEANDI